ncbi:hypothetical protein FRB99_002774 [Tulasnella sp. 403]|nr:hypothetical protein FRB99_002774 [Tulasnella sp. 403]
MSYLALGSYEPILLEGASFEPSIEPQTPILPLLWTVFASILEVFILCLAGWILARKGIIDKKTQKQLNRINVSLFTPSLLFSKVAFALNPQKLKELWIIPILFVVITVVSALVAWVMAILFRLKRTQRNFAMAAAMFNNSNSLPIALMQSLVITVKGLKWGVDDNKDAMLGRALSYLVLYSTLGMMLRWSYGVHLLSQSDDANIPEEGLDQDNRTRNRTSVTFSLPDDDEDSSLLASENPGQFDYSPPHTVTNPPPVPDHPRRPTKGRQPSFFYSFPNTPTRSRVDLTIPTLPAATSPDLAADLNDEWGGLPTGTVTAPPATKWESIRRRTANRIRKAWAGVNEFMTVPMWAASASLIVACVRPAQHALEAHMEPVKGALVAAGNCSIPITLIVLGAYFHTETPQQQTSPTTNGVLRSATSADERRSRYWSSSEMSIATLTENIRETFKLRPTKKPQAGFLTNSDPARQGESRTVFVAIISRMILAPALVLPAVAALAVFDLQRVMEDPVFVVSLVLLVSSPPALTLAQITQAASGDAFERLISKTIFWSYCIFTPPLTIFYIVIGLLMTKL